MKKISKTVCILVLSFGLLFATSCSSDDNQIEDNPNGDSNEKYIVMTLSEAVLGSKAGFVSSYDEFPSGTITNIGDNSLQGSNMGGFIPYKNAIYKKFSTEDNSNGIEKIKVNANGKVYTAGFLQTGQGMPGSGNFVIADEDHGFYWDMDEPLKIQTFNPEVLARTGSIDLEEVVNERGVDEAGITFRSIGRKFLVVKNGKLFADLSYASTDGGQSGLWDDFYEDVYLAVIDIASQSYEKTIKIEDTGSIAYVNENRMHSFNDNGDLYFITQGRSALGGLAKVNRIKANATDIDTTWKLKYSEFNASDEGKFTGLYLYNNDLFVSANTQPLTGGPNGNINTEDLWKVYKVDLQSKEFSEVEGIPGARNLGASELAAEIDGNLYFRVATNWSNVNGYFLYDPASNSASQAFGIDVGGFVSGFYKMKVD